MRRRSSSTFPKRPRESAEQCRGSCQLCWSSWHIARRCHFQPKGRCSRRCLRCLLHPHCLLCAVGLSRQKKNCRRMRRSLHPVVVGFPQNRSDPGICVQCSVWVVIPRSTVGKEEKRGKGTFMSQLSLWATGAPSHRGSFERLCRNTSKLFY